jgi:transcription elongation GreA/GreB family factor
MPQSRWLQLAEDGDLDAFETQCLEALEEGDLPLAELVAAFEELEKRSQADRVATLGQMVLENLDADADPPAALRIARVALLGDPQNQELRKRAATLYRRVHGDKPGFDTLLQMSGLESGRPARNAVSLIDVCLTLEPGAPLISRAEDVVVEVLEVDRENGLVMLKHPQRSKAITASELSREYERVAPDDFRVLRALKPERLAELLESDPVAVVIGLIHARGEVLDQDLLKHELVPKYISAQDWPKWWSRARAKLQRSPHVIIEGRAPVVLRYTAEAQTLEDTTWETFASQNDPSDWLTTLEGYLREKRKHKEPPDAGFLTRCHAHLDQQRASIKDKRPSEALACALVSAHIHEATGNTRSDAQQHAAELLRRSDDPAGLIAGLTNEKLWTCALETIPNARPEDAAARVVELVPLAPAPLLDRIITIAREAGLLEMVQTHIDTALADPADSTELIYWLWRGPEDPADLRLPTNITLFASIIETLSALGRTLYPDREVMRRFRQRMRAALTLHDYARARACIQQMGTARAVTLRTQLERLEGVGENARSALLKLLRKAHPDVVVVRQRRIEPWENPDVLWNTAAGIKRKTKERDHLVNVSMRENAKRIGEAAAHGDLSENSEYRFALEERDLLRARLAQMNHDLAIAQEIDASQVPTNHIGIGSRVTLRDISDGTSRVMTFLGSFDTDVENGIYNYRAPLSKQLMGRRVGDRTTLTLDERERVLEVARIANALSTDHPDS